MQRHNQVWGLVIIAGWVLAICLGEYAKAHGVQWQDLWAAAKIEALR